jgi:hypothetical protein
MVAAKALACLQSVAASTFATNQLVLSPARHLGFAHEAAGPVETRMATPGAERIARIGDRRRQLGTAAWVAAIMPNLGNKIGHDRQFLRSNKRKPRTPGLLSKYQQVEFVSRARCP